MADKAKDPVCGMTVDKVENRKERHESQDYYFCSDACKTRFHEHPESFTRSGRA